jgi:hypothetical protein
VGGSLPLTGHTYPSNWQQDVQQQKPHPKQLTYVQAFGVSTRILSGYLPLNVQGLNQDQSAPASEGGSLSLTD